MTSLKVRERQFNKSLRATDWRLFILEMKGILRIFPLGSNLKNIFPLWNALKRVDSLRRKKVHIRDFRLNILFVPFTC